MKGPGINAYNKVATHTGVSEATPHRLIMMLLEAASEKVAKAKGFLLNGKIAEKGNHISHAISIVDALRVSLDKEAGGEISTNLESLYEYIMLRLTDANLSNDETILDEVLQLITPIKDAWAAIPVDVQEKFQEHQIESGKEATAG